MAFEYLHTVNFHETDAAGVVYFANGLVLCHQAYEASLASVGIDVKTFFSPQGLAYPIVHASIDFRRPLHCGDPVAIALTPTQPSATQFHIHYQIRHGDQVAASAQTHHICINAQRQPTPLPEPLLHWLHQLAADSDISATSAPL